MFKDCFLLVCECICMFACMHYICVLFSLNLIILGCNWKYNSCNLKYFFSPSSGKVQVKLSDEKGGLVPIQVLDNDDGTYSVDYVAPSEGNYKVIINFSLRELMQNDYLYFLKWH